MSSILVVDDEHIFRTLLCRFLEQHGHQVSLAVDGEEAIRLLACKTFQVIITDLQMGTISGHEVARFAKSKAPESTVIMITGNAAADSRTTALRCGADSFLLKPFDFEELFVQFPQQESSSAGCDCS